MTGVLLIWELSLLGIGILTGLQCVRNLDQSYYNKDKIHCIKLDFQLEQMFKFIKRFALNKCLSLKMGKFTKCSTGSSL